MKFLIPILGLGFLACSTAKSAMKQSDQNLYHYAVELAQRTIIVDGHVDLPSRLKVKNFRLEREFLGIPVESDEGDFDYMRARQGGLDAPFMSIYVPSHLQADLREAKAYADTLIDLVAGISSALPDKFARGDSPEMIEANSEKGLISLPMGMENGAPITTLQDVRYYYDKGIRYVTLTHAKDNHISDSSYDTTRTWGGLSEFGKALIREMNTIGMMVDVSHISDSAFYQVMRVTRAPVIASHSSCRIFTPGFERNMDDDMIRTLAENGGVIHINFGSAFLDGKSSAQREIYRAELRKRLEKAGLEARDPAAKPIIESIKKDYPAVYSDVKRVADHIDHVVKIAGIDYVGLGSDFDGVGDSLPEGLKDVSMYPNLIYELLRRDYTEEDIRKICYGNVWRVWHAVNEIAAGQ
jgi:membrane dipeptidase